MGNDLDGILQRSVWKGIPMQQGVRLVTFVNPFSYFEFCNKSEIIEYSDFIYADGALLVFLNNIFHKIKIKRLSFDFSSIAKKVFDECERDGLRLALVGAHESEVDGAQVYFKNRFPELNICFSRSGYFNDELEIVECYRQLFELRVEVVLCGMGTPRQEEFLIGLKKYLDRKGCSSVALFTCGGFLSQTSMRGDYYHPFVKKWGLRWLQRFVLHAHVRQRVLSDYPSFVAKYIWCRLLGK